MTAKEALRTALAMIVANNRRDGAGALHLWPDDEEDAGKIVAALLAVPAAVARVAVNTLADYAPGVVFDAEAWFTDVLLDLADEGDKP